MEVPQYDATLVERIARVCHETNRAYCFTLGDTSQPPWDEAPDWQRKSAIQGVEHHLSHPSSEPCDSHNSWLAGKQRDGWKYGPVKDPEKKEHPCFVPYADLPHAQQMKDHLFLAIVRIMSHPEPPTDPVGRSVVETKHLRRCGDMLIQRTRRLNDVPTAAGAENMLALRRFQEGVMWLGMALKAINDANPGTSPNPYPNSKDPSNTQIDPTDGGMKL